MTSRGPFPLFGVLARTERGRASLSRSLLSTFASAVLPMLPTSARQEFWRDPQGRVAILCPDARLARADASRGESVIALRGCPLPQESAPNSRSLLRELERDGLRALQTLRGEFALAFWSNATGQLLLARDALGQRSLFLRTSEHYLVFSSELEPLLSSMTACELDHESALHFLAYGRPAPGRTLAVGVESLKAGHAYVLAASAATQSIPWFTPLSTDTPVNLDKAGIDDLRRDLDAAIAVRVAQHGTQGLLLSGGIDSTYIARRAREALGNRRAIAYTIAFGEGIQDERAFAAHVAKAYDFEHRVVMLDVDQARSLLCGVLQAAMPCSAWATISHRRILEAAREDGVEHILSGLGSDEIFGGYDAYERYALALRAATGAENGIHSILADESATAAGLLFPGIAEFFDRAALDDALGPRFRTWRTTSHLRSFYRECLARKPDALDFELMVAHECAHRIPTLLSDFDTLARAARVRFSYPFLDPGIAKLGCGLSYSARFRAPGRERNDKLAIRAVARPFLPRAIMERTGASYTAPFGPWMRNPRFGKPVLARLRSSAIWSEGLLRRNWLGATLRAPTPQPRRAEQLWVVLALAAWYDRYVANDARPFIES